MEGNSQDTRSYYRRVMDGVIEEIRAGRMAPDAPVPSAAKLAEQYGVSVPTAQRALRELKVAGLTRAVPGMGTFVHRDAPAVLGLVPRGGGADFEARFAEFQEATERLLGRYVDLRDIDEAAAAQAHESWRNYAKLHPDLLAELLIRDKIAELESIRRRDPALDAFTRSNDQGDSGA
ncbi:winged helix-turn-helix transcriptional regulator [Actinocrinis puniceicyclus]|jgi:DNA-binding transcriptional regulator YhcF (GntR family)|uniref:Winged helix-turn-helix transcriptional regulator n=1 Tax=Actinocrinis puniceicyclus TaxID=977794 RepID=A0A8J8BH53_9ACTN|nr:winged helix-turn-helix domain-containing protein [Actinocrinis puniceicyclus]MBS2966444.1 winged helix-turn-helix transcriptional regulator [Actinocrinis puniceicyclus]